MQTVAMPLAASTLLEARAELSPSLAEEPFVFIDGMADVAFQGSAECAAVLRNCETALAAGFRVDFERPELGINMLLAAPLK